MWLQKEWPLLEGLVPRRVVVDGPVGFVSVREPVEVEVPGLKKSVMDFCIVPIGVGVVTLGMGGGVYVGSQSSSPGLWGTAPIS